MIEMIWRDSPIMCNPSVIMQIPDIPTEKRARKIRKLLNKIHDQAKNTLPNLRVG
jgi:hypothetical protein